MSPERTSPKIKVKILSNEAFSQEDLTKAQQQLPQYSATSQYPMGSIAVNTSGNQHQQHFHGGNSDVGGDFVATPTMPPVEYRMSMDQTAMQIRNDSIDASNNHAHSGAVGTPSKKMDAFADDPQSGSKKSKAPKHKIHGNTPVVMALLSEMWIVHIAFILGFTYLMTFVAPQNYLDGDLWNNSCYWKIGWLLPLPYTCVCFISLVLPFRTSKFLVRDPSEARRIDNLYILTVTKGDNKKAVMRAWNAHKHLEQLDACVRVHVLTDEPHFFDNINCFTCPKNFTTANSKYKARALEWYRQTMRYTEYDWILHLDEESVIDDHSVKATLDFIRYEKDYTWGQGVILYNQYRYWTNWIFTVADAIRVGDDLARFHLQFDFLHSPLFGAHGSFLLTNGVVENTITWDLGSLTEDYQFATHAWEHGYMCGKVPGLIREQSPMDLIGFLKQRRRWYVGIRRLPLLMPKIWWFFWTLGTLSLYFTVASIILDFTPGTYYRTPRWMGLLKDFSFVNFVYLYILGIFIQDIDAKSNFLLTIIHIPMSAVIQFIAVLMEALAVMYGLLFPPSDFDVIKK